MSFYLFPTVRGIQAKKEYYVSMIPLKVIPELFPQITLPLVPACYRSQRLINKSRIPSIKRYILNNPNSYILPSIVVSVDGGVEFQPFDESNYKMGYLKIFKNSKFIINDGQHRIEAIKNTLKECPELNYETISTIFYVDIGLKYSQQIFTDLNRHTVKPTPSLSILYDKRDELAELARYLSENVYYFKDITEFEKTTISNRSKNLFTLNAIYHAARLLLNKKNKQSSINDKDREINQYFWTVVGNNIEEWKLLKKNKVSAKFLRDNFIHSHSLFLYAIALVGNVLISNGLNLDHYLDRLSNIDWKRSNSEWEGVALNNGRLNKAKINIDKTFEHIIYKMGLQNYITNNNQRVKV